MYINTSGIVLREVAYKDSSKILTILTSSEGKLTVSAHGAHRKNSKLASSTGLLVFSEMTLFKKKDRWTMSEARSVEQFAGLRNDLKLLALGTYFAELAEAVSDEDSLNTELLPLCLNALYALSEEIAPPDIVKPAFELRLMAVSGFEPLLHGKMETVADGHSMEEGFINLGDGAKRAAEYILNCNVKKLCSFSLSQDSLKELSKATENYLLKHLDRSFRALEYYHKID